MDGQVTVEGIDALLIPFLSAQDEAVSETLLARLSRLRRARNSRSLRPKATKNYRVWKHTDPFRI
jgi:hypothetical protein